MTMGPIDRTQLEQLVHDFYASVRRDPELGPIFERIVGDHWGPHLARMVEFWCTVMLNSHTFKGNVFGKHMALEGIRPGHFLRWLTLWNEHTAERFAGDTLERLQDTARGIARNLFYGFFGIFPVFVRDGTRVVGFAAE
jgi:hemoglobin